MKSKIELRLQALGMDLATAAGKLAVRRSWTMDSAVSLLKGNPYQMPPAMLKILSETLDCSVDYLLELSPVPNRVVEDEDKSDASYVAGQSMLAHRLITELTKFVPDREQLHERATLLLVRAKLLQLCTDTFVITVDGQIATEDLVDLVCKNVVAMNEEE